MRRAATPNAREVLDGHSRHSLVLRYQPKTHWAQKLLWWPVTQEALPWSAPPAHALVPHGQATAMVGGVPTSGSPSLETSETSGEMPSGR